MKFWMLIAAFPSHSQQVTNCPSESELKQALILIAEGKYYYSEWKKEKQGVDTLLKVVASKEQVIKLLEQNYNFCNLRIQIAKSDSLQLENIITTRNATIESLNKSLRQEKRKKWVWGIKAAALTGSIIYGLFKFDVLK